MEFDGPRSTTSEKAPSSLSVVDDMPESLLVSRALQPTTSEEEDKADEDDVMEALADERGMSVYSLVPHG